MDRTGRERSFRDQQSILEIKDRCQVRCDALSDELVKYGLDGNSSQAAWDQLHGDLNDKSDVARSVEVARKGMSMTMLGLSWLLEKTRPLGMLRGKDLHELMDRNFATKYEPMIREYVEDSETPSIRYIPRNVQLLNTLGGDIMQNSWRLNREEQEEAAKKAAEDAKARVASGAGGPRPSSSSSSRRPHQRHHHRPHRSHHSSRRHTREQPPPPPTVASATPAPKPMPATALAPVVEEKDDVVEARQEPAITLPNPAASALVLTAPSLHVATTPTVISDVTDVKPTSSPIPAPAPPPPRAMTAARLAYLERIQAQTSS